MSNSSLISYTKLSPNHSGTRTHAIDTITIHMTCGQSSVEGLGGIFAKVSRQASCNYGIGNDGRIGLYVDEANRSWCSSSASNDHRAITIETASDATKPYAVRDVVYRSLIRLLVDICKRNGIKRLVWSDDKADRINHRNGCNMTVHRDFADTSCPGEYLYTRMGQIAQEVNAELGAGSSPAPAAQAFKIGNVVKVKPGSAYYNSTKPVPDYVLKKTWVVLSVKGSRVVIDRSADGESSICSPIDERHLELVAERLTASTPTRVIVQGDKVTIADNAVYYGGSKPVPLWVRKKTWVVLSVSGDRVVVDESTDGKSAICSAINAKYLTVAK